MRSLAFVVPRLPEFDRASGDLRLYRVLEILARHYRVVLFDDGAWERFLPWDRTYADALAVRGVQVVVRPTEFARVLRAEAPVAVVAQFHFVARRYARAVRTLRPERPFVVDSVDVHFLRHALGEQVRGRSPASPAVERLKREEVAAYREADRVWAVSELDRQVLVAAGIPGERITVVPNIHRCATDPPPLHRRAPATLLFVGGFRHAPNEDAALYVCERILPLIESRVPGVRLQIVGADPPPSVRRLARCNVEVTGFVPDTGPYLDRATLGIAPLRFGAGLKGKVTEAMAAGLPVVTTSVGAQGLAVRSWRECVVADTAEEFAAAVVRILGDPDLWATLAANGRTFMTEQFGYEAIERRLLDFFEELEGHRPPPGVVGRPIGVPAEPA